MNEILRTKSRFTERMSLALDKVRYEVAQTPEALEAIYRLRYDANLREKAIERNETKRLEDRFDHVPNVINLGVYLNTTLLSGLRFHILSKHCPHSPAFEVYNDLLDERIERGDIIVDGNRFVANYPLARSWPQLPYITLRLGILAAEYFGARYIIASVRTEHFAFYKREYLAERMCEPRPYPTLVKPLSLISINYGRDRDAIVEKHGFYASTPAEREAIYGGVLPDTVAAPASA